MPIQRKLFKALVRTKGRDVVLGWFNFTVLEEWKNEGYFTEPGDKKHPNRGFS